MKTGLRSKMLLVLFTAPVFCFSQYVTKDQVKGKAKEYYEMADNDFQFGKLPPADSLFHLAVKEKDNFIDAWVQIGQLNLEYMHRFKEAAAAFEKVKLLSKDYMPEVDYQLGKCYLNMGEYGLAKTHINDYLKQDKIPAENQFKCEKMLSDCDFGAEAMKHPYDFHPVNLGSGVNTAEDESMPTLTADEKYLYFTRHTGLGIYQDENIFMSIRTGNFFSPAEPLEFNTDQYVEGAQSISPSGKYLFFTSAERPDGEGRADIYMTRKIGDHWDRPNNMGPPINGPGWDAQPCISADGRALYFASIRQGTRGGSDLWVSYYDDKTGWGKPENLGDSINTQFDEMRPFIHPDGQTLYFSSNGHPGMGNFDIYMSKKHADGAWGAPVDLGYPINTPGDEIGLYVTTDGSRAYYASEQKDSKGQMDIYSFDMPAQFRPGYTSYIAGNVYDKDTRNSIPANVQVYDVATGKLFATFSSDKLNGNFLSTLPAGKNYAVEVQKDGYLFYSQNIS
ncbi:MAG TPA: hypothetical protein VG603_15460, partial [Chitinophagales bacterium]|nr:hypothetical protein [Chitinophagales bacterium]